MASKILIPDGKVLSATPDPSVIYFAENATGIPVVPGARRALESNLYVIVFDDTGKPADYQPENNRHTIAMDVQFVGGYLDSSHTGLVSRHKGSGTLPPTPGDNRSAALIAGNWGYGIGSVALEEIEIKPDFTNGDSHLPGPSSTLETGVIQEDRWYRMVLESISLGGKIGHRARMVDKLEQERVYDLSPVVWSAWPQNYDARDAGKVVLFSIADGAATAGFRFTHLKSYWTQARTQVRNP